MDYKKFKAAIGRIYDTLSDIEDDIGMYRIFTDKKKQLLEVQVGEAKNTISNIENAALQLEDSRQRNKARSEVEYLKSEIQLLNDFLEEQKNLIGTADEEKALKNNPKPSFTFPISNTQEKNSITSSGAGALPLIKQNMKLAIYGTMTFVGILWLFTYLTSLTDDTALTRTIFGFVTSIGILITAAIVKGSVKKKITLSLTGYIIGILALIYGASVGVGIPVWLTLAITLIYGSYGFIQVKKFNSEPYNVIFILSSCFILLPYDNLAEQFGWVFAYLIALTGMFIWLFKSKKSSLWAVIVPLYVGATELLAKKIQLNDLHYDSAEIPFDLSTIILSMLPITLFFLITYVYRTFSLKVEFSNTQKVIVLTFIYMYIFSTISFLNELAQLEQSYLWLLPLFAISSTVAIVLTKNTQIKSILEANYIALFASLTWTITNLDFPEAMLELTSIAYVVLFITLTIIAIRKKFPVMKTLSIIAIIVLSFLLKETPSTILYIVGLICITAELMKYQKNETGLLDPWLGENFSVYTAIMGSVLVISGNVALSELNLGDGSSLLNVAFSLLIVLIVSMFLVQRIREWYLPQYVAAITSISWLFSEFDIMNNLDNKYWLCAQIGIVLAFTSVMFLKGFAKGFGLYSITLLIIWVETITLLGQLLEDALNTEFFIFIPAILLFAAIVLFTSLASEDTRNKFVPVYVTSIVGLILFVLSILDKLFEFREDWSTFGDVSGMYIIEILMFLVLISFAAAYLFFKNKNIYRPITGKVTNNIFNFFVRVCVILPTLIMVGFYIGLPFGAIHTSAVNLPVIIISIIYIFMELKFLEKNGVESNSASIFSYSIIAVYLIYLVFIELKDIPLIIKGIAFLIIGVYGVLKARKNIAQK